MQRYLNSSSVVIMRINWLLTISNLYTFPIQNWQHYFYQIHFLIKLSFWYANQYNWWTTDSEAEFKNCNFEFWLMNEMWLGSQNHIPIQKNHPSDFNVIFHELFIRGMYHLITCALVWYACQFGFGNPCTPINCWFAIEFSKWFSHRTINWPTRELIGHWSNFSKNVTVMKAGFFGK